MRILLILSVSALSLQCFGATDWYVDNAATGLRNGTSWENAWTNFNSVTGTSPGDFVNGSGGTVSKTYLDPFWTPPNGVTLRVGQDSGHNGELIWDGRGVSSAAIFGAIKNFTIDGGYNGQTNIILTNFVNTGYSVWCDGMSHLTVKNIKAYNSFKFGPGTNLTIINSLIKPPAPALVGNKVDFCLSFQVRGVNSDYTNNLLRNVAFIAPTTTDNPEWGSDCIQGGRSATVENCYFGTYAISDNTTEYQHTDGWQPSGTDNSNVRVRNNVFENIANYGLYWECTGSTTNVQIYNNIFRMTNSASATEPCVGIVFAFQGASGQYFVSNVVANNTFFDYYGYTAASFGNTNADNNYIGCVFANNLAINSGASGSTVFVVGDGSDSTNGIWIAGNKGIALGAGNTNISLPQMYIPSGNTNVIFTVPFATLSGNNTGIPSDGDQAVTALGVNLSDYFTTDARGLTRLAAWDIGANMYVQTIFPNTPRTYRLRGINLRP